MEGGDGEDFGESHGFQGGTEGGGGISCHQQGINEGPIENLLSNWVPMKGGINKNKNEQSLMGDQVNVFLIQPKSPPPSPPPH